MGSSLEKSAGISNCPKNLEDQSCLIFFRSRWISNETSFYSIFKEIAQFTLCIRDREGFQSRLLLYQTLVVFQITFLAFFSTSACTLLHHIIEKGSLTNMRAWKVDPFSSQSLKSGIFLEKKDLWIRMSCIWYSLVPRMTKRWPFFWSIYKSAFLIEYRKCYPTDFEIFTWYAGWVFLEYLQHASRYQSKNWHR